jgi:integrase
MATITKRGSGWSVQVRRKGFSAQYRTFRLKRDAEAWARLQEARVDQQNGPIDSRALRYITLGDILRRYLVEVTPSKRSADSERLRLGKVLRAPMCDLTLADLTAAPFAAFRDDRLRVVRAGTVRREFALIRHALEVARREWNIAITDNPLKRVTLPQPQNARSRRLNAGELQRLKEAFKRTRNPLPFAIIVFAIETGLRRGEILQLQWPHVDLDRRTAYIPQTKTGHPRTIPLTDGALGILGSVAVSGDRVFPMSPVALRLAWDRACVRAGLENLRFHDMRHEALSRFAELGLTVPELAVISGHRDPRMLFRYTHLRPQDLAAKLAGRCWSDQSARGED